MPLNDDLYASSTQQTYGEAIAPRVVSEQVTEAIERANEINDALRPAALLIDDLVNNEIERVADIRSYFIARQSPPTGDEVSAEYRGREMYIAFLNQLKTKTTQILKEPESK